MTEQPTALRLADALSATIKQVDAEDDVIHVARWFVEDAAAELRRLSEIETLYLAAMRGRHAMSEELLALTAQRDALLEALKEIEPVLARMYGPQAAKLPPMQIVRAAIKQAEENT